MKQENFRVLVLCTGNSARSQIADALINARGAKRLAGRVSATSAGSHPATHVNQFAIEILRNHGVPFAERTPRSMNDVAHEQFDLVITVCDNARDACPIFPSTAVQVHWGLADPAHVTPDSAARQAFAQTFAEIAVRVDALLALPLETLSAAELKNRAEAIHQSAL
ncbi:MAG: arsenate reductase ArsC [Gemmatimonadaceae bacterium]